MTSLAPREAKWSAVARPIPRDAPVTMATRSWSGKDGVGAVLAALLVSEAIIIGLETRENRRILIFSISEQEYWSPNIPSSN